MSGLDNIVSKVTYDNKTIIGLVGVCVGVALYGFGFFFADSIRFLLLMIPPILLIVPKENIKFNKILAIIFFIVGVISFVYAIYVMISATMWMDTLFDFGIYVILGSLVTLLMSLYAMMCSFLLFVPTNGEPFTFSLSSNSPKMINQYNPATAPAGNAGAQNPSFCKECGAKINTNSAFCPECGKKI